MISNVLLFYNLTSGITRYNTIILRGKNSNVCFYRLLNNGHNVTSSRRVLKWRSYGQVVKTFLFLKNVSWASLKLKLFNFFFLIFFTFNGFI